MPVTHRDQKWASDLLELELHVVMSCQIQLRELRSQIQDLSKCSSLLAHLSILSILLFKMWSLTEPDTSSATLVVCRAGRVLPPG